MKTMKMQSPFEANALITRIDVYGEDGADDTICTIKARHVNHGKLGEKIYTRSFQIREDEQHHYFFEWNGEHWSPADIEEDGIAFLIEQGKKLFRIVDTYCSTSEANTKL